MLKKVPEVDSARAKKQLVADAVALEERLKTPADEFLGKTRLGSVVQKRSRSSSGARQSTKQGKRTTKGRREEDTAGKERNVMDPRREVRREKRGYLEGGGRPRGLHMRERERDNPYLSAACHKLGSRQAATTEDEAVEGRSGRPLGVGLVDHGVGGWPPSPGPCASRHRERPLSRTLTSHHKHHSRSLNQSAPDQGPCLVRSCQGWASIATAILPRRHG